MKHYIIVKWNELVKNKNEFLPDIKRIFEQTKVIDGVSNVEYIENVVDKPNRSDLVIRITMDKNSLEQYNNCDAHKEWKEKYSKYIESKAIFDSEE